MGAFDAGSIVATLDLDRDPFQAGLAAAESEGEAFASQDFTAKAGFDTSDAGVVSAEAAGASFASQDFTAKVGLDTSGALASLATLKAGMDALGIDSSGLGRPSVLTSLLASAAASSGGGGGSDALAALAAADAGGGGGGLLKALGWGGGLFGAASFLSPLSLLGFGGESILTTALGTGGSAVGGLLGGGLLGLGALGTMGVGMGTDLSGIGQAVGDTTNTFTALGGLNLPQQLAVNNAQAGLNNALVQFGQNSPQYAAAYATMTKALANYNRAANAAAGQQNALNTTLQGFSSVAQPAVLAAAEQANALHMLFNAVSGQAEAIGANILNQLMQVAEAFLPTIGKYATENMGIIQSSLQPLLSWLQGPGLSIFTELENIFQSHLPAAMSALDNGIELVIRTIGLVAPQTGKIVEGLSNLFAKLNGPDWGQFSSGVEKLIGMFEAWAGLLKSVGSMFYDIFSQAAGVGTTLVKTVTSLVTQFNAWTKSAAGVSALKDLFSAHFTELFQGLGSVVSALLPVFESFISVISELMVPGHDLATGVLVPLAHAIGQINLGPVVQSIGQATTAVLVGLEPAVKALGPLLSDVAQLLNVGLGAAGKVLEPVMASLAKTLGTAVAGALQALTPIVSALTPVVGTLVSVLGSVLAPVAETLAQVIGTLLVAALHAVEPILTALLPVVGQLVTALGAVLVPVIQSLMGVLRTLLPPISQVVTSLGTDLAPVVTEVGKILVELVKEALTPLVRAIDPLLPQLAKLAAAVLQIIPPIAKLAGQLITAVLPVLSPIISLIGQLAGAVVDILKPALDVIVPILTELVKILTDIIGPLTTVIGGIAKVSGGVVGGALSGISDIAHLFGSGGLVTAPTLGIVGEAGPELVLPLNDHARMMQLLGVPPGQVSNGGLAPGALASALGSTSGVGGGLSYNPSYRVSFAGPPTKGTLAQLKDILDEHAEDVVNQLTGLMGSGQRSTQG